MEVSLKIICVHEAMPAIKQRVKSLCTHVNADAYEEDTIINYWKCEDCSVYNVRFRCHSSTIGFFESELYNISGGHRVEVDYDGLHAELSCYTTVSELKSNPCSAFVTCYISL